MEVVVFQSPHLNMLGLVVHNPDKVQVLQRDKPSSPPECTPCGVGAEHTEGSWGLQELCKPQELFSPETGPLLVAKLYVVIMQHGHPLSC